MKFSYTIMYVPDVTKTLDFYKNAFDLHCSFLHESKQYGELDTGETKLAFASEALATSNGVHFAKLHKDQDAPAVEITLVCDDVYTAYDKACNAGCVSAVKPIKKPWGQMVAYVRDLNGVLVGLASPIN